MRWSAAVVGGVIAFVLMAGACGGTDATETQTSATTAPPVSTTTTTATTTTTTTTTTSTSLPDSRSYEQRMGDSALSLVDYPWQELGFRVSFEPGREGLKAATMPETSSITVYVRQGVTVERIAQDTAHELGHAYDLTRNDDARREEWKRMRGYPGVKGWFACSGCSDLTTPVGDFAETFAYVVLHGRGGFDGRLRPAPSGAQLDAVTRFIRSR